jgi:hypothetical protein
MLISKKLPITDKILNPFAACVKSRSIEVVQPHSLLLLQNLQRIFISKKSVKRHAGLKSLAIADSLIIVSIEGIKK